MIQRLRDPHTTQPPVVVVDVTWYGYEVEVGFWDGNDSRWTKCGSANSATRLGVIWQSFVLKRWYRKFQKRIQRVPGLERLIQSE